MIKDLLKKKSKPHQGKNIQSKTQFTKASKINSNNLKDYIAKLLKSFRTGPEIFQLLIKYGKTHKIQLNIPDTLIYLPSISFPAFLMTMPDGTVRIDVSRSSVKNFFAIRTKSAKESGVPEYIHIAMNERIKLCYDDSEAKAVFEDCPHFTHRLHKYIKPYGHCINKLRVHWKLYKPPVAYIVSNDKDFRSNTPDSNTTLPALSKVISVQDTSIPSISVIDSSNSKSQETIKKDLNKFIVRVSSTSYITISNRYLYELQDSFKAIVNVFNTIYFRNPNKLEEAFFDFIRSSEKKWVLIACKGHRVKGDSIKIIPDVIEKPFIEDFFSRKASVMKCDSVLEESLKSDLSLVSDTEDNRIEKVAQQLQFRSQSNAKSEIKLEILDNSKNYLEYKQADKLGRIPHLMIGVKPQNFSNSLTYFIENSKDPPLKLSKHKDRAKNLYWVGPEKISPEKYFSMASKCLNNIEKTYNKYRKEAAVGRLYLIKKKKINDIITKNSKEIKKIFENCVTSLSHNKKFSNFFENKTEQDMCRIASRIIYYLNPISELAAKTQLKNAHKGLGITKEDFSDFVEKITADIKNESKLEDNNIEIILDRIKSFEDDIVTN